MSIREEILTEINRFRLAYWQLSGKRTPTPEDVIILQGNTADAILSLTARYYEQKITDEQKRICQALINDGYFEDAEEFYGALLSGEE